MHTSATDSIVGRRLRIFRLSKGYDIKSLSVALNVDPETVERYENGLERIPPRALRAAAEVLEVSLHAFFDPHNAKVVPCATTEEPARPTEPASDFSEAIQLLEHFGKVKDRTVRAEILKFVAFLASTT